jgi:cytochrome c peroxidase
MKHSVILFVASLFLSLYSCNNGPEKITISDADQALMSKAKTYFAPLPLIAKNPENTKTKQKIALGHKLYFDTQLSMDQTISCNSCHNLATYGVDREITSIGDDGGRGTRNSPTVLNAALHTTQFWDGRAADVEEQAGMPILNPVEMAIPNEEFLVERLKGDDAYPALFVEAFPDQEDPLTYENIRLALALFERELLTPSPFDEFIKGDPNAISAEAKEGLNTFVEAGCITCHSGALMGGNLFQKFGVYGNYWEYTDGDSTDAGRYNETKVEADKYMFKVPTLRNVAETYPYLHNGSVSDLKEVISLMGKVQLNKDLSPEQVNSIAAFLETLTSPNPIDESYIKAPIAKS